MLLRPPPLWTPSRRQVLAGGLAALTLVPRRARAASAGDRKFIFVLASGGWDPTRVLADGLDHAIVDAEVGAQRAETAGLSWVDAESRPSVRTWFERYADQAAIVEGILVPSIAHEQCIVLALTGSAGETASDWPSILGAAAMERYPAPTLVLGGPYFPGDHLPAVVQAGGRGQLGELLSGAYADWSERVGDTLQPGSTALVDAYIRARSAAALDAARSTGSRSLATAFQLAAEQQARLGDLPGGFAFQSVTTLAESLELAASALSSGVARVAMVSSPPSGELLWDSHTSNDEAQNFLWEQLFASLVTLFDQLETLPGETTATLLEETTVVVYSEMGRTPWLNPGLGKDHWPHTSMLLAGSGIRGGMNIGGYDSSWYGVNIDPESGLEDPAGVPVTCASVGATLLALGDIDPAEHVPGAAPIPALMAR